MADLKTTNIYGDAYINNKVGIATNAPATRLQIGQLSPTAATEGIQFGDDPGTRIYRSGAGVLTVSGSLIYPSATVSGTVTFPNTSNAGLTTTDGTALFRLDDIYGNIYLLNSAGGFYVDATSHNFRNASSAVGMTISSVGDVTATRYVYGTYVSTSDDVSTGNISHIVAKFGDNFHRSATAAKVAAFLNNQTMSIAGNAATATALTSMNISQFTNNSGYLTSAVTSAVAGTGISVSGATGAVTITNSSPNATHTGDVTGATALTIANDAVTTVKILNANVTNAKLANSSLTIGSTAISLGATATTIAGLTSVTSTTFVGALTGNATTATALTSMNISQFTNNSGYLTSAVTSLAGTTNRITVSGATGAVTLNLPQDIHTGASPTFSGLTVTGITMTNLTGAYQNTTVYDSPRTQSATPSRGIRAPASSIQFTDSYAIAPFYTYRSTGDWPVPYGIGWGTGGESSGIFQRYASNGSSFGDMIFYTGNDGSGAFSFRRHTWEGTTYFAAGSGELNTELFRIDWSGNLTMLGTLNGSANSATLYANNGSYGAWAINGTRNGWGGIEFANNGVSLMMGSDTVGFHQNTNGWLFRVHQGIGYIYKGAWGGGTAATILDSSNAAYAWNMNQNVRSTDSPTFGTLQLTRLNFGAQAAAPYAAASGEGFGNGITFGGDENSAAYRIFTGMENIGGNYSKLTFNWHTGIRIGAAYQYGGTRFYDNYVGAGTKVFSIAEGDSNVRVYNELFVQGSGIGAYGFMKYGGTRSGDWQLFTTSSAGAGQMNVVQVENIGGGGHTNYPTGVYTYGGVMSWRLPNHSFQLYAAHTGDLAYKTQWNNDNYSGWRRILDSSTYPYAANMNQYVRTTDTCSFAGLTVSNTINGSVTGNAGTVTNGLYTTGGQTIAGITYFSNGESINAYGIRGRFTNEYLHLYNKVGVGHPSGWGQGETSTPTQGLSTYGGLNIAYGDNGLSTFNGVIRANSNIRQGADLARPLANWSVSGTSTGMVIFSFPGNTGNYGMVHCVFDIYEYNSNTVSTVIVGGHNWSGAWYNIGANVIGRCGKSVRLGVKDSKFCVVFGGAASSWEYGTIILRKIHNGGFYTGIMDMGGSFTTQQTTTESFSNISGDLRLLRTSADFIADGGVTGTSFSGAGTGLTGTASSLSIGGNAATATTLATGRAINGVSFNGSAAITVDGLNYSVNNVWLRENGDDAQFQMYGNSRTMIYRTDGNTNPHGGGGYAHIFYYGGSADANRMFIINTDGRLWSNYHGWLDAMSITGNAATVGGLAVHGGRNNEANKIVRTDSNGYIQAGWINTTSGDMPDTESINKIYCSSDDYVRYKGVADFKQQIGLTYKNTTPRSSNTTDTNYWTGVMGWGTTDLNDVATWGSGFFDTWSSPGNGPGTTSHYVGLQAFHYSSGANTAYGFQMVSSTNANRFHLRSAWPTWQGWVEMLTSGNYNSFAPTLTGTGASGTWAINVTGNAATATILQTARNINGTSFNGSAAITTATWGTARTLTIGSTGKSVDGSAAIAWSLAEIGAAATNQTMFIGTTSVAINRASSAITLTGTSIDGNAATATSATSATYLNSSNYIQRIGSSGNYNTDFQNTPAGSVRHQGDDYSQTNCPGGSGWWFVDNYRHSNASNYWGTQVAWGWEDQANKLATRNITNGNFGSWIYYLNSNNYTDYTVTKTGTGASGTWGINITGTAGSISGFNNPTTAATANTIVYRDASGHITGQYILGSYFNASAGNGENPTIGQIWTQNTTDNYLRKSTPAHFRSQVTDGSYPSLTGANASGTWSISVTGNAGTATSAVTAGSCTGNAATATLATKASTLSQGGGNGTGMTFNWSGQGGQPTWLWGSNDGTNIYVWNPSNFNVNYATSAGSATSATTAGSCSGNAATATNVAASGITGQTGMWTSAVRPGPYRLYRNDDNSAYNVQLTWQAHRTNYWSLRGYLNDTFHAECFVVYSGYADSAGSAGALTTGNTYQVANLGINVAASNKLHINGDNANPAIRVDNGAVVLAASVASNGRGFYGWLPISIGGTTKWIQLYNNV